MDHGSGRSARRTCCPGSPSGEQGARGRTSRQVCDPDVLQGARHAHKQLAPAPDELPLTLAARAALRPGSAHRARDGPKSTALKNSAVRVECRIADVGLRGRSGHRPGPGCRRWTCCGARRWVRRTARCASRGAAGGEEPAGPLGTTADRRQERSRTADTCRPRAAPDSWSHPPSIVHGARGRFFCGPTPERLAGRCRGGTGRGRSTATRTVSHLGRGLAWEHGRRGKAAATFYAGPVTGRSYFSRGLQLAPVFTVRPAGPTGRRGHPPGSGGGRSRRSWPPRFSTHPVPS